MFKRLTPKAGTIAGKVGVTPVTFKGILVAEKGVITSVDEC